MRKRFDPSARRLRGMSWLALAWAAAFGSASCVQAVDQPAPAPHAAPSRRAATPRTDPIHESAPDAAPPARVRILTWNLDWFQDPTEGPKDDAVQYAAARDVLADADASLIALEEIASESAFDRLLADLPEYAGVLSGYDWTQKTALLWRASMFELSSARALSGLDDAGRPPLEIGLRDKLRGEPLLVVVIHAKAQADEDSRNARERLAQGVKAHLDAEHGSTPLVLLGDFNDRLNGSITAGAESPYRAFVGDARYATPTLKLDDAAARESSYSWGATIDHIVVSDELAARVDDASVDVRREELLARYPGYTVAVSDHFPVTLELR